MPVEQILYYSGLLVWLFPPFRQFRTNYFFFFLMLAVMDPMVMIIYELLGTLSSSGIFVLFSYVILLSILERSVVIKYFIIFAAPVAAILLAGYATDFVDENTWKFLLILLHFLIFSIILKLYALKQVKEGTLNWFYVVLLFYELTLIFKFVVITLGFSNAAGYFIITTFVQLAFGLFFSIFREDNPGIISKLR